MPLLTETKRGKAEGKWPGFGFKRHVCSDVGAVLRPRAIEEKGGVAGHVIWAGEVHKPELETLLTLFLGIFVQTEEEAHSHLRTLRGKLHCCMSEAARCSTLRLLPARSRADLIEARGMTAGNPPSAPFLRLARPGI